MFLTNFFDKKFYHNTVQEWAIALAIILGGIIAAKILYWIIGRFVKTIASRTKTKLDDILVDKLEEPIVFAVGLGATWYAITGDWQGEELLHFRAGVAEFFSQLFHLLLVVNITWLVVRTLDALIEEYLVPLVQKSDSDLDDQLMPIARKGVRFVIWTLGIIIALDNAGFDVGALIAGLGIGGLALALAAQDTVKNVFGGVMIFVDKPFRLGDRVKVNGFDGMIEEIGLRTTRLRTLAGRLVTIPNSTFMDQSIENVSMEPSRKVSFSLGLTYDTSPEDMEKALAILHQLLADKKDVVTEDTWTTFDTFGDFALGILFTYYIRKGADITATQTMMSMEILKRFNEAGLEFAFPTQTIYKQELKN